MKKLSANFILIALAALCGCLQSLAQSEQSQKYMEAQEQSKTFLIVDSYSESTPWSESVILPITYYTANDESVHTELYHLNSVQITDSVKYRQVYDEFFNRFGNRKIDYFAFIGQVAFSFRDEIKRRWGDDIPMLLVTRDLYVADNKSYYYSGYDPVPARTRLKSISDIRYDYNFTTIYVPSYYKETIDLMHDLLPKMNNLVFFVDGSYFNRTLANNVESYLAESYPMVNFELVKASASENWKLQYHLMHPSDTTGLLLSSWFYEKIGPFGYPILVSGDLNMLSSSTNPIFSLRHAYMNIGAIGGVYYEPQRLYDNIYSIVKDMAAGVQPRDMKFCSDGDNPVKMINYQALKEYGLQEKNCPPGTLLVDKPKSFWQKYTWPMVTVLLIFALIFFLMARRNMAQRHEIEILSLHKKFIDYMPVPYSKARIQYTPDMKVANIKYTVSNQAFDDIVKENGAKNKPYILFPNDLIAQKTTELLTTNRPVTFLHHFPETDKFIVFTLCLVESRRKDSIDVVDYIDIFANDITERQKNERRLRETTQRLDLTINIANIIPWEWDMKTDIMYVKSPDLFRRHDNTYSTDPEKEQWSAIPTADFMRMIIKEDKEEMRHAREQIILNNISQFHIQYRICLKRQGKEEIEWFDATGAVSERDAAGKATKVIGTLIRVTDRKRQENELIEAEEKARNSDRLKSAFLANMSHEIRTPLNAIVGFSSLMAETEEPEKRKEFAKLIDVNNNLLLSLVNDVLDLAKIESNTLDISKSPTDLNLLMHNVGESIRSRLKHGVTLNKINGADHCYINIDANRIIQVLLNLLNNAAKFTAEGSITFGYNIIDGKKLHFFVKDTGIGISKENQKRLYQRFDRLNLDTEGNGLGLSICKHLIERMGGEVGMESEGLGKGSTFWFDIPYEPVDEHLTVVEKPAITDKSLPVEEKPARVAKRIVDPDNDDNRPLILIAEDIEGNFLLLKSFLGRKYRLEHAWDGQEAVKMYRELQPDLILMDISMPKMDGYQATEIIRRTDKSISIIAVTAYAYATDRKRILSSGFDDYVAKPISREQLNKAIEYHLNK